ncbi:MAG TPA: class A beta-lactamase, partial [Caulobacteraceae bacterium]|nr:class A beta-lactamase [Caulobacteraceae bacterium]
MTIAPTRRLALQGLSGLVFVASQAKAAPQTSGDIAGVERELGARVGVYGRTLNGGRHVGYRADERFAMCSTFKLLLAAAVLRRVDRGEESLARAVAYGPGDLLSYAPTTRAHLAQGSMSLEDLCAAAVILSDNTAANLLLGQLGGPPAVTAFARGLGDPVTRLDRMETALNDVPEGDARDTTSPAAMAGDLRRLLFGDALSGASRERLTRWLVECRTGLSRIRAGVPSGARVGDKTGTWDAPGAVTANDVAVIWPAHGEPLLLAIYVDRSRAGAEATDRAVARLASIACA